MSHKLIMLGPPGAGKGTQATRLSAELNIPQISTGDMLREARAEGTEMGKKAASFMDQGHLVPDEVVIGIVDERLSRGDTPGYILDGFPRTVEQADALTTRGHKIDSVILIEVDDDLIVERITGRLSCGNCGAVYHRVYNKPTTADTCDSCSHVGLTIREDDKEEVVRNRLSVYKAQTEPLVAYYRKLGLLRVVNGEGDMDDVYSRITKELAT